MITQPNRARYATLDRLAATQHGLLTTAQLERAGVSRARRTHAQRTNQLVPVRRGVYRVMGMAMTWEGDVLAAVCAAGPPTMAAHETAGALWGLTPRSAGRPIEVVGPRQLRLTGITAHRRVVPPAFRSLVRGIPVTSTAWTIVDLAATMAEEPLGKLVDEAVRARVVTMPKLWAAFRARVPDRPRGAEHIRAVLAERVGGFDPGANEWELRMDRQWDRLGLPAAVRQYEICVGRHRYRPDRAIVELRIAVDWNGYTPHGERSAWDHDSVRRAELTAAGWQPLDFTAKASPAFICRIVGDVVTQRRRALGLAHA